MAKVFAAPLNAVDRLDVAAEGTVVAVKAIVADDPYLCGHYPHFTIYPGVFSIETVYQAVKETLERDGGTSAELVGIISVRFSAPLLPGDVLTATCELACSAEQPELVTVTARCQRGDGQGSARIKLAFRLGKAGAPDA